VADLFTAIILVLPLTGDHKLVEETSFCKVTAVLGIFWPVASFLWTDCVAWYLYRMFSTEKEEQTSTSTSSFRNGNFLIFHVVCWTIPAVLSIIITVADVEGYNHTPGFAHHNTTQHNKHTHTQQQHNLKELKTLIT